MKIVGTLFISLPILFRYGLSVIITSHLVIFTVCDSFIFFSNKNSFFSSCFIDVVTNVTIASCLKSFCSKFLFCTLQSVEYIMILFFPALSFVTLITTLCTKRKCFFLFLSSTFLDRNTKFVLRSRTETAAFICTNLGYWNKLDLTDSIFPVTTHTTSFWRRPAATLRPRPLWFL